MMAELPEHSAPRSLADDPAVAELAARIRAHLVTQPAIRRQVAALATGEDPASRRARRLAEVEAELREQGKL
jgi:hypothetical protein